VASSSATSWDAALRGDGGVAARALLASDTSLRLGLGLGVARRGKQQQQQQQRAASLLPMQGPALATRQPPPQMSSIWRQHGVSPSCTYLPCCPVAGGQTAGRQWSALPSACLRVWRRGAR
jgi:hypothetical protein